MAIKVASLLDEKARRFGASANSTDFQQQFLDSINYALDDIDERLGLTTARVTSTSESISLDEQQYRGLISYGLDVYIADAGEWNMSSEVNLEARWREKLDTRQMNYMKAQSMLGGIGDVDEDLSGS
jgi:hypothetical protein|tara:strand:+ start:6059 stop:6439 length:381 start_codon:yes stop_codon:yes gene_type:complete